MRTSIQLSHLRDFDRSDDVHREILSIDLRDRQNQLMAEERRSPFSHFPSQLAASRCGQFFELRPAVVLRRYSA